MDRAGKRLSRKNLIEMKSSATYTMTLRLDLERTYKYHSMIWMPTYRKLASTVSCQLSYNSWIELQGPKENVVN